MTEPTDETLMAYADGLLPPTQRTQIERLCADDAGLRARLQVFHATGRSLGQLFQGHVSAPVPERLLRFVAAQEAKLAARKGAQRPRFWSQLKEHTQALLFADASNLRTALIAGVVMVCGIGVGWLLRAGIGGQETVLTNLVQVDKSSLIARAPLQHQLNTLRSGKKIMLALGGAENVSLKVKMTFRNAASDYCRVYEMAGSLLERYAGVACRKGDQWSVRIQAVMPPSGVSPQQFVPAGGEGSAIDAVVSGLIEGDPLSATDEAALIGEGWKK